MRTRTGRPPSLSTSCWPRRRTAPQICPHCLPFTPSERAVPQALPHHSFCSIPWKPGADGEKASVPFWASAPATVGPWARSRGTGEAVYLLTPETVPPVHPMVIRGSLGWKGTLDEMQAGDAGERTPLCPSCPRNHMVSTCSCSAHPSLPCSIYRIFIVLNKIKASGILASSKGDRAGPLVSVSLLLWPWGGSSTQSGGPRCQGLQSESHIASHTFLDP